MKNIIHFEPLTPNLHETYIKTGTQAYNQHYLHLWMDGDSAPYIQGSFTTSVLQKEATDNNTILYLIQRNGKAVGILKITLNSPLKPYASTEALYVDKIYILNAYSGQGIGKKVLQFVQLRAKESNKKIVWLDAMQKGPALDFYLKNGYEIYGESKVPYATVKEDEKLMWILTKKV